MQVGYFIETPCQIVEHKLLRKLVYKYVKFQFIGLKTMPQNVNTLYGLRLQMLMANKQNASVGQSDTGGISFSFFKNKII
jgi:hypothetical protein